MQMQSYFQKIMPSNFGSHPFVCVIPAQLACPAGDYYELSIFTFHPFGRGEFPVPTPAPHYFKPHFMLQSRFPSALNPPSRPTISRGRGSWGLEGRGWVWGAGSPRILWSDFSGPDIHHTPKRGFQLPNCEVLNAERGVLGLVSGSGGRDEGLRSSPSGNPCETRNANYMHVHLITERGFRLT